MFIFGVLFGLIGMVLVELFCCSGYVLGVDICGSGDFVFFRVQIDMKVGFCVGFVVSEEDCLKFLCLIVQVLGCDFFVVVDMGGWGYIDGWLLLFDLCVFEGGWLKEIFMGLDYFFGFVVGLDKKLYVLIVEMIFCFDLIAGDLWVMIEIIICYMLGCRIMLFDGSKFDESVYLFKVFVFDRIG